MTSVFPVFFPHLPVIRMRASCRYFSYYGIVMSFCLSINVSILQTVIIHIREYYLYAVHLKFAALLFRYVDNNIFFIIQKRDIFFFLFFIHIRG